MKAYGSDHDHVDENGQTPLFYAIKSNRLEVLKYLLELGVNSQLVDNRGHSPMNMCMRHNKTQMKEMLIKYGAPAPPPPNKPKKEDKKPAVPIRANPPVN